MLPIRVKQHFCKHEYVMKKFILGSLLTDIGMLDTFYPTCIKCKKMLINNSYTQYNPDFKHQQQA